MSQLERLIAFHEGLEYNDNRPSELERLISLHKFDHLDEFQTKNPVALFYRNLILTILDLAKKVLYPQQKFSEFEIGF